MTHSRDPLHGFSNPVVCFSHLPWDDKLFQRPQQIMSKLAQSGIPVIYFACVGYKAHKTKPMSGQLNREIPLYVYTLQFSPYIKRLHGLRRWLAGLQIATILARHRIHNPILWFYHPALFALGYSHKDAAIVYDVMDHFPSFEEGIDDFYFDELALLAEADIVVSGGRSLHRHIEQMFSQLLQGSSPARSKIECLPSGVDLNHFMYSTEPSSEIRKFAEPRFIYSGAIDERIDWDIITELARATSGSVIMVGPVLRSAQSDLPDNVHLLGARKYDDLPQIIAACDVCLLPFKSSNLVQYVSPTKTPEYLAMGKPVISTPIPDVISDYAPLVTIAPSVQDFVTAAIRNATVKTNSVLVAEQIRSQTNSWDDIAGKIAALISFHVKNKSPRDA